jgi:thiol-activated cytolysin
VAFLKDNSIATMGFATDYTETSSVTYPNGYVKFRHEGGYIAAFRVSWDEADANGNYHAAEQFNSGDVSMGWQQQVNLPGDARNVRLQAWCATGISSWNEIMNTALNGPDNKCYKVYGTIWEPRWDNNC